MELIDKNHRCVPKRVNYVVYLYAAIPIFFQTYNKQTIFDSKNSLLLRSTEKHGRE